MALTNCLTKWDNMDHPLLLLKFGNMANVNKQDLQLLKFIISNNLEKGWSFPTVSPISNTILPGLKLGSNEWNLRINDCNLGTITPLIWAPYPLLLKSLTLPNQQKNKYFPIIDLTNIILFSANFKSLSVVICFHLHRAQYNFIWLLIGCLDWFERAHKILTAPNFSNIALTTSSSKEIHLAQSSKTYKYKGNHRKGAHCPRSSRACHLS